MRPADVLSSPRGGMSLHGQTSTESNPLAQPTLNPARTHLSQRAMQSADQPISALMERALAQPQLISLAAGFVDQHTLPAEATSHALQTLMAEEPSAHAALQYGTTPGYPQLRKLLLEQVLAADGLTAEQTGLSVDQVVVTAGSNQLLHLVSDCLLDPGDIVLCTAPTYFVYLGVLRGLGAQAVGVAMDQEGLIPEALEQQLVRLEAEGRLGKVKAIYVVSYFDNPSSITLSHDRRAAIVEIAQRWSRQGRIHIIEDAAYRELRYVGEDLPSLRSFDSTGQTVIFTQTFSKSFSPGLRVGFGLLPKDLVQPVCALKGNLDFGSPNFAQHLMARVLSEGLLQPQVQTLRQVYLQKLQAMLQALQEHLGGVPGVDWIQPTGGLYVWLTLPKEIDTGPRGQLFERAISEGVLYVPGEYAFPAEPVDPPGNTIRLSFGVQPPNRIQEGIRLLAQAIKKLHCQSNAD